MFNDFDRSKEEINNKYEKLLLQLLFVLLLSVLLCCYY